MYIAISIGLGLLSMTAYGLANAFSRPLSRELGAPQVLFLRGFTICAIMLILSLPSLHNLSNVAAVTARFVLGLLGYLPLLAFTHGMKTSRLGIVAPIAGTSPFITIILAAVFLGAAISRAQWLAIIVIVAANIAISVNLKNWRESNVLKLSSGIPFAVMASVGWGLFFFFFIYSTNALGPWLGTLLVEAGVTTAAGLHLWLTHQPVNLADARRPSVMANAALICLGTSAFAVGVHSFSVPIVAALSNSTSLVSAVLATLMFHERFTRTEIIAGACMIGGVAVIALA